MYLKPEITIDRYSPRRPSASPYVRGVCHGSVTVLAVVALIVWAVL